MMDFSWKFGIALLTVLGGTTLALLWVTPDYQTIEVVEARSWPERIETSVPNKTPEPPSEIERPKIYRAPESKSAIRRIKNGGQFCEKYLLRRIARETSADSQLRILGSFDPRDENLSPKVKEWLDFMWWEENLLAAELRNHPHKAILLRSHSRAATGLSTSLESWLIEIDNHYSVDFSSFSGNPELVFWDKDGWLNYYSVVYGDEFLSVTSDRDYSNLTFNIERYKINSDGGAQLISEERNLKCE